MRRIPAVVGVVASLLLSAACSLAMRPVPVAAAHIDWEALAGEWHGTYRMDGYDRYGTIAFKLVAVEEQASGEVLMIPQRTGWPYAMNRPLHEVDAARSGPRTELLTIRFVEAAGGTLRGTMDPYWDPDRRCTARASFTGVVEGSSASGSVTSVCDDNVRMLRGSWRARRNPPAEPRQ